MNEWLTYSNQGATRNLPLSPELVNALATFVPDMGLSLEVYSGGQPEIGSGLPRVGSTRHDLGGAGDGRWIHPELGMLDVRNPNHIPILQEIVRRGRGAGLTGFGMGQPDANGNVDYMGPHGMHFGFGAEAVWGAGGNSANAPQWLRDAYFGAEQGTVPGGAQNALAMFPGAGNPLAAMAQGNPEEMNRLALMQAMPQTPALDPRDFMTAPQSSPMIPIGAYMS